MSRIRTIKPEFWTSEQVISCSLQARLLFIGLWNFCDDNGIHPASLVRLKAEIFPADSCTIDDIQQWIDELINNNLLHQYNVTDKSYWCVTGWKNHQRIDKPNYRYPLPEKTVGDCNNIQRFCQNSATSRQRFDDHSTNSPRLVDDHSTTEWKGMEGNGVEIDIGKVALATSPLSVSKKSIIARTVQQHSSSQDIQEIFNHWRQVMHHPHAKLDKKRTAKIMQALKLGYNVYQLKQAIDGCVRTPFNMGANDRNQKYDGIDLIFRDADHIERFMLAADNTATTITSSTHDAIFAGVI